MSVVFGALGACCFWYALYSEGDTYHVFMAGVMCVFAWAFTALFLYVILPGKRYLELTSQGFTLRYGFNSSSHNWRDVQDFGVFRKERMVFVVFNFARGYVPPTPRRQRTSAYARKLTGYDSSIGSPRYGMSAEELADLMNKLRQRYAGATGAKISPDDMA